MLFSLVTFCLLGPTLGLYEDQAFKFDWRERFIGDVEHLKFVGSEQDGVVLVGTRNNVVAALDSDNGRLLWRHKFESERSVGALRTLNLAGKYLVSVSGSTDLFVRLWEPTRGTQINEHLIRVKQNPDFVHLTKNKLWLVYYKSNAVEITSYHFDSKKFGEPTVHTISSPGEGGGQVLKCAAGKEDLLVCATPTGLLHANFKTATNFAALAFPPSALGKERVNPASLVIRGARVQVEAGTGILTYEITVDGGLKDNLDYAGRHLYSECPGLRVEQACSLPGLDADGAAYCARYANEIVLKFKGEDQRVVMAEERGKLEKVWSDCNLDPDAFQLVLAFEDGSLLSLTPRGNVMFVREEGLANIQKAEFVGMGLQSKGFQGTLVYSDMFDFAHLLDNFVKRIRRHVSNLQTFLTSLVNFRLQEITKVVTPDRFGLKKIIVVVTEQNKMYGVESTSGKLLWQTMFPGVFSRDEPSFKQQAHLLIQKDGRSGDYAQAVLIYKHHRSNHFIMTFDPLTGRVKSNEALDLPLDQAFLLPELPEHDLKPVLLIGKDGRAEILPANAIDCLKEGPPLFIASKTEPGKLVGKKVTVTDSNQIVLTPVWSLVSPNTEIIKIDTRDSVERVHSAGRVLADRSVLFKYMNPNLALVLAQGTDSTAKVFINVYLLDLVTGKVYYSASHKKILPPFHAVHSENWAVYSFFNDKARRTELVSLELYEGNSQHNASIFSSIDNPVAPFVERQAYILPTSDITSMRETMTEQGITSKHLLIGTGLGSFIDLPMHMLDPRRPSLNSAVREPGLPPYIPELSVPHESIMNYNQTLLGTRAIVTSPSGLESTTLVFAYGLDLYGTRLTPSKGFDLIKEDFDYLMISSVILGLAAASYVTRRFSQKKMLANAWK